MCITYHQQYFMFGQRATQTPTLHNAESYRTQEIAGLARFALPRYWSVFSTRAPISTLLGREAEAEARHVGRDWLVRLVMGTQPVIVGAVLQLIQVGFLGAEAFSIKGGGGCARL
jgi:hypothetical protein